MPRLPFLLPCLVVLLFARVSSAESPSDIPNPLKTNHSWVADQANVLDTSEEAAINNVLSPLERQTEAEVAVVTVKTLDGASVDEFANDLFRLWGSGKKGKDNGVLVLAAIQDRKSRIEVGYGLEGTITDAQANDIIQRDIKPAFRSGNYGSGLLEAVKDIASLVPGAASSGAPPGNATAAPNTPRSAPTGSSVGLGFAVLAFVLLIPAGILIGIIVLVKRLLNQPKKCPNCGTIMERIPDKQEEPHLQPAQQYEQRIGAVDYKIWRCPQCHKQQTTEHDQLFSKYKDCPKCGNRTLLETEHVVERPTYDQLGVAQVNRSCTWRDCGYEEQTQRSIPRLENDYHNRNSDFATGAAIGSIFSSSNDSSSSSYDGSSSDSSSSFDSGPSDFGGGDSGGGGSSDSW